MLWAVEETLIVVGSHICGETDWLQSRELPALLLSIFGPRTKLS